MTTFLAWVAQLVIAHGVKYVGWCRPIVSMDILWNLVINQVFRKNLPVSGVKSCEGLSQHLRKQFSARYGGRKGCPAEDTGKVAEMWVLLIPIGKQAEVLPNILLQLMQLERSSPLRKPVLTFGSDINQHLVLLGSGEFEKCCILPTPFQDS